METSENGGNWWKMVEFIKVGISKNRLNGGNWWKTTEWLEVLENGRMFPSVVLSSNFISYLFYYLLYIIQ